MWSRNKEEMSKNTKKQDAVRRCVKGYECKYMAKEKLKHLVAKDALNIEGLGKKVIDQFWDLNFIREPSDIFKLDYEKIKKMEGWGNLSISNLKIAIDKSRNINLEKFIYSVGIGTLVKKMPKYLQHFLFLLKNFQIF